MNDKNEELQMLVEIGESFKDLNSLKKMSDFSSDEQIVIKGILKLFVKHCKSMVFLNIVTILTRIINLASIIFLALLLFKVFPYYVVVIILLLLCPIFSIIKKSLFYSLYNQHKKIEKMIAPYNIEFSNLFELADEEEDI